LWVVFVDVDEWVESGLPQEDKEDDSCAIYSCKGIAASVISRAQALVYNMLADSMIRSLE
jgi:hypothetical protein